MSKPAPDAAQKKSRSPRQLWEVLRDEYQRLRPHCQDFAKAEFNRSDRTDSQQLPELFKIVGSWSGPPQPGCHERERSTAAPPPGKEAQAQTAAPPSALAPLSALCFSGGGIRSATFNLGVLRGLARLDLLGSFDYLSSVSGGGYISGWLARWVKEEGDNGICKVSKKLASRPADPTQPEPQPVVHLRQFSNYLTPRLGVLSADTWTMVAIFLRNLLLTWVVLLPILTAPLILPLLAVVPYDLRHPRALLFAAGILELSGLFFVSLLRASGEEGAGKPAARWTHWYLRLGLLPRLAAVPLLLAAVAAFFDGYLKTLPASQLYGYCAAWALGLPLLALLTSVPLQQPLLHRKEAALGWEVLAVLFAGGLDALVYTTLIRGWLPYLLAHKTLYAIFGPSLVLGTMLLGRTVFVAVSSISEHWQSIESGDADREWWARWSAWTLVVLVVWMAGSALVLFAPTLLASASALVAALISGVGLGGMAALLGRSPSTPANQDRGEASLLNKVLLALAAPLFAVALVLLLAWSAQQLLESTWPTPKTPPARVATPTAKAPTPDAMRLDVTGAIVTSTAGPRPYRANFSLESKAPSPSPWHYVPPYRGDPKDPLLTAKHELLAILALLVFGIGAGYPVNANRFSMQAGYRNRLIRAYLGASNPDRKPNLFTGFDTRDNVHLRDLEENRPLPVINMALNLVRGDNLAWQERKAESFTATPFHCGASTLGYRPTAEYGGKDGLTLGTAVATSGAAANPNMGLYSSPVIGFIMAFFNVRLGIWLGNPKWQAKVPRATPTYRRNGPRFAARVLVDEAFGLTDADHPYINLSDGGHFEDLGLYEMVRRRCRTIFVSDAGADPSYAFDDLGNAIRKIRIDFGIPIVFKERVLIFPRQPSGKPEADARYCAIAEIQYGAVDQGAAPGTLVYIKPSICMGSPFDVENYARKNPTFPHQSTANQWFSESQFESYRALGQNAVEVMAAGGQDPEVVPAPADLGKLVARVQEYVKMQKAAGTATTVPPPVPPSGGC